MTCSWDGRHFLYVLILLWEVGEKILEIGFVIPSEEIIADSFYSFLGLPDKRLFPSVSAVYGNTEVSMVYLGPPLDGWNSLKNLHIKKKEKAKPVQPDDKNEL